MEAGSAGRAPAVGCSAVVGEAADWVQRRRRGEGSGMTSYSPRTQGGLLTCFMYFWVYLQVQYLEPKKSINKL